MIYRLSEIVGEGYSEFWHSKKRYRVVKGGRASKKSKTCALWLIYNIMRYEQSNAVVFRKTYRTLKDSCFSDLKWAIHRLGVDEFWTYTTQPLEMTYTPTGQKILFRGLDDPMKVTSISVEKGYLCFAWLEEAFELTTEDDFNTIDESIRGAVPEPLFKGWMISFNPWSERSWLKRRFFDNPDENTLAITTTYHCNEWLDEKDRELYESLKTTNPRRYQVAALGNWGVIDGLVYERFREHTFTLDDVKDCKIVCGLDFGYTQDPSAFVVAFVDQEHHRLYIYDEMYEKHLLNRQIFERIQNMGYAKEKIIADSADPRSIDELRRYGLRINPAKKGQDSIIHGVQTIQDYEILIHPRCVNFITEIQNYQWDKDRFGKAINRPIDDFNHLMDALRYAMEAVSRPQSTYHKLSGGL